MAECRHGLESGCADCARVTVPLTETSGENLAAAYGVPDFGALWEAADEDAAPVIEARYDGWCPLCCGSWEPGEAITRDEGEDAWVHAHCGSP